jgi:hypothetical protein
MKITAFETDAVSFGRRYRLLKETFQRHNQAEL